MDIDRLLSGLDADQRRAATEPSHPLRILAGAGSGKTRALTRRIAHRSLTGTVDSRHVLALTFTRRAAAEMQSRLAGLGLRDEPTVGTFHAIAWAQLRSHLRDRGRPQPNLLDRKARFLATLPGRPAVPARELAQEIEWARARLVTPEDYPDAAHRHDRRVSTPFDTIGRAYRTYEDEKRRRGVVDFDDVLGLCAQALDDDPTFAAAQHWRFRHLFVDEFQDVNPLQHRLLMGWLGDRDDLCVVGDPDQAIYRWNGADASFLVNFEQHHPGAVTVRLRTNYRSTPEILGVAAAALGDRTPTASRAHRPTGSTPRITRFATDADEARGVADAARVMRAPGTRWDRQAILVRTNAQVALMEHALTRARIPFRIRGTTPLLDDPTVRGTLRDLRTVPDRALRIVLTDLELEIADAETAGRTAEALASVIRLGHELLAMEPNARAADLRPWLATALGADGPGPAGDAVDIVTFHAAKGLEWPVVHIAGVEDGLVPIVHARTPEAAAEERRLLYVAITRGEDEVRISWAARRTIGDRPVDRRPSPYLDVLEAALTVATPRIGPTDTADGVAASRAALGRAARSDPDRRLLRALQDWRADVARRAATPVTVVASDRVLSDIARRRPTDLDGLAAVDGLGPIALAEHGTALLRVVLGADQSAMMPAAPPPRGEPCDST